MQMHKYMNYELNSTQQQPAVSSSHHQSVTLHYSMLHLQKVGEVIDEMPMIPLEDW